MIGIRADDDAFTEDDLPAACVFYVNRNGRRVCDVPQATVFRSVTAKGTRSSSMVGLADGDFLVPVVVGDGDSVKEG